jgi:hypothetical protein
MSFSVYGTPATKIDIRPLLTKEKALITSRHLKTDGKCLWHISERPWSLYGPHRLRHFRSQTPPSGRNRLSAVIGNQRKALNFQMVYAMTEQMPIEHYQESMVGKSNGDVISGL